MGDVRPVTYQQTKLLNALHSRFAIVVTRERLRNVLFADRIDGGPLCADDVLKQQICYLRKKLAGWPFQITAHYGSGYALTRSVNPSAEVHAKAYPYAVRAA
jgi:DNA-binding winged helix-turn-helix (wHTH) protein